MAVDLGSTFKDLIDEINNKAKTGERGFGFVASVSRSSFTEAQWTTYGSTGHTENWSDTADIRNDCRIGDLFIIVGTATDTGNAHMAIYRSDTASGALHGECIAHFIALRGKDGTNAIPTIQQGTGENAEVFNGFAANRASGAYSHAEGYQTTASNLYSHAEGNNTQASGGASHAEGYETVASGAYSHAEGCGTVASGAISHAAGIYNDYSNMGPGEELSLGVVYCIGNGLGETMRQNAFEVWFNGRCRAPTWDVSDVASHPKNLITVEYAAAALTPIQEAINSMVKQVKVNGETKSPDSNGLVDLGTISSGGGEVGGYLHHITITGNAPSVSANLNSHGGNVSFLIRNDISTPYTSVDEVKTYIRNLGYSYYDTTKSLACVGVGTNSSGETVYGYGLYIGASSQIEVKGEVYTTDGAKNSSYTVYGNNIKDNVIELPQGGDGGNSELVQFQVTNIRMYQEPSDDENYALYANISIRVLAGELHKGDMIQLGVMKNTVKYNKDDHGNRVNTRRTTRFRNIASMTLTQGEVDSYNDKVKDIFTLGMPVGTFSKASNQLNTDLGYNTPLFMTHTDGISSRRPLILRIVRTVRGRVNTWNKLISNKVQVLTDFTYDATEFHLSAL